jgi:hypothetical protein
VRSVWSVFLSVPSAWAQRELRRTRGTTPVLRRGLAAGRRGARRWPRRRLLRQVGPSDRARLALLAVGDEPVTWVRHLRQPEHRPGVPGRRARRHYRRAPRSDDAAGWRSRWWRQVVGRGCSRRCRLRRSGKTRSPSLAAAGGQGETGPGLGCPPKRAGRCMTRIKRADSASGCCGRCCARQSSFATAVRSRFDRDRSDCQQCGRA